MYCYLYFRPVDLVGLKFRLKVDSYRPPVLGSRLAPPSSSSSVLRINPLPFPFIAVVLWESLWIIYSDRGISIELAVGVKKFDLISIAILLICIIHIFIIIFAIVVKLPMGKEQRTQTNRKHKKIIFITNIKKNNLN